MELPINQIICDDNCKVMSSFEDESIDLTVTSPPYDDLRDYCGHSWNFEEVAKQLFRITKQGGVLVWVVSDAVKKGSESGTSFRQALKLMEAGFRLHDTMIYRTNKPPLSGNRYQQCFEYMFVLSKGAPKSFNPLKEKSTWAGHGTSPRMRDKSGELKGKGRRIIQDEKVKENIWYYQSGSGKEESLGHPAPFPLQLAKDHISSWSNTGDIVLDPFAGSGTTLKAAKELNRHFIGIEVAEKYVKICEARVAQEVLNLI